VNELCPDFPWRLIREGDWQYAEATNMSGLETAHFFLKIVSHLVPACD
jgi:hypothetical protein